MGPIGALLAAAAAAAAAALAALPAAAEVATPVRSLAAWARFDAAHPANETRRRLLFVDEAYPQSLARRRVLKQAPDDPWTATAAVFLGVDPALDALFQNAVPGELREEGRSARRALSAPNIAEWTPGETHRLKNSLLAVLSRVGHEQARRWAAAASEGSSLPVRYCVLGDTPGCAAQVAGPLGFKPHHEEHLLVRVAYGESETMQHAAARFSDAESAREAVRVLREVFT